MHNFLASLRLLQTFSETKGKGLILLEIGRRTLFYLFIYLFYFIFFLGGRGVDLGLFLRERESFKLFKGTCGLKRSDRRGGGGVGEGKEKISRDWHLCNINTYSI